MIRRLADKLVAATEPIAGFVRGHADEVMVLGVAWVIASTLAGTGL